MIFGILNTGWGGGTFFKKKCIFTKKRYILKKTGRPPLHPSKGLIMNFTISNPNAPGTQFNELSDEYFIQTFDFFEKKGEEFSTTYKSIQGKLTFTSKSYVRNLFPFWKNAGLIEYDKFVNKNLFTDLGKIYYHCIHPMQFLHASENDNAVIYFQHIKQFVIRKAVANIIQNSEVKYGDVFRRILTHLLEWKKINENEFALILYQMQNGIEKEKFRKLMKSRRNSWSFKVRVKNKKNKSRSIISFSYFINTLKLANIVKEGDNNYYIINCNMNIIKEMI